MRKGIIWRALHLSFMVFVLSVPWLFAQQPPPAEPPPNNTFTMTTYYPAPFGAYKKLTVGDSVGIGTTNPEAPLHVHDATIGYTNFLITQNDTTSYSRIWYQLGDGTGAAGQRWNVGLRGGNTPANSFAFEADTCGAGCWRQHMVITPSGNVGIGTASPNLLGSPHGRYLTIRGMGPVSSQADARIELSNPNTPAANNYVGDILFIQEGNNAQTVVGSIDGIAEGSGGANGYGGAIEFWTKTDNSTIWAERMRINNAGNVGIGTTDPAGRRLAIAADPTPMLRLSGNVSGADDYIGHLEFQNRAAGNVNAYISAARLGADNSIGFVFFPINAGSLPLVEAMRIMPNGNVGIGTTSPSSRLHVWGGQVGGDFSAGIRLTNIVLGGRTYRLVPGIPGTTEGGFSIVDVTASETTNRLVIDSFGKVGIGTTIPTAQLHVRGPYAIFENLSTTFTPQAVAIKSGSGYAYLSINAKSATGGGNLWMGVNANADDLVTGGGANEGVVGMISSNKLHLGVGSSGVTITPRMTIDTVGNVGIGTTSPNARLQVKGGDAAVTTQGNGMILRATDGTNCYRLTVNNAGALTTASVTCP